MSKCFAKELLDYGNSALSVLSAERIVRSKYNTPTQVAELWSRHFVPYFELLRDPLRVERGVWDDRELVPEVPVPLVDKFSAAIQSIGVRGIGPRLERGNQFRLHISSDCARRRLLREIDFALGDYEYPDDNADCSIYRSKSAIPSLIDGFDIDIRSLNPRHVSALKTLRPLIESPESPALQLFMELWGYIFAHFTDTHASLGRRILADSQLERKLTVFLIDTGRKSQSSSDSQSFPEYQFASRPDDISPPKCIILLGRDQALNFHSSVANNLRRRIMIAVLMGAYHIIERVDILERYLRESIPGNLPNEVIRHFGRRIVSHIQSVETIAERTPDTSENLDPWYGVATGLERLRLHIASTVAVSDEILDIVAGTHRVMNEQSAARSSRLPHLLWRQKLLWADIMTRFLLQHAAHGRYFYFLSRKFSGTPMRTTLSLGTNRPLTDNELTAFCSVLQRTTDLLDDNYLHRVGHRFSAPLGDHMPKVLTQNTLNEFKTSLLRCQEGDTLDPFEDSVLGGLPHYLVFADALAGKARHEGKAVSFEILVADGVTRHETLRTLASFERGTVRDDCWVTDLSDLEYRYYSGKGPRPEDRCTPSANPHLVAQILGNFAFLQRPNTFLLGNRSGRLLAIVQGLIAASAEVRTAPRLPRPGDEMPGNERDPRGCYLIRIDLRGRIELFHRGRLLLQRNKGAYEATRYFEKPYRSILSDAIRKFIEECCSHGNQNESWVRENRERMAYSVIIAEVACDIADRRGLGACFVLARYHEIESIAFCLTPVFPHAEGLPIVWPGQRETLFDLAIQDGAVVIDALTGATYGRRYLRPGASAGDLDAARTSAADRHPEVLQWGTRHLSSLELSLALFKRHVPALVVTVSSDGGIHVFQDGIIRSDLTWPSTT